MTPIAPIQFDRSITPSSDGEALSATNASTDPATPSSRPETTTPSSLASLVPTGGLHPVAPKPQTDHFAFGIFVTRAALHERQQTTNEGMNILIDEQRKRHIDPPATTPL